ncbi:hypothetical protein I6N96_02100 [Enterococcus sp. BWM-S5]|uniref:Uncharacterized protein n=1 Tax=Enterococcus larvae TaxID=2794352 RepID=A0ABS4CFZ1_9ENTE|nr:hypothetical protein [Enterococcus larvae]MBP1045056.1 hypothetical protein [Enterococcus larvae]
MTEEQEKRTVTIALENIESDFLEKRRYYEDEGERLVYEQNQLNRSLDEFADSTTYYLRKFGVEESELSSSRRMIENGREELLYEIHKERQRVDNVLEEHKMSYQKERDNLEEQLLEIGRE